MKFESNAGTKTGHNLAPGLFMITSFIISVLYFYFFKDYIFFFQENQSLFIYTADYFHQFASKPGGLLVYAGNFLTQGYYSYFSGALILSFLLIIFGILVLKIVRRLSPKSTFSSFFIAVPMCLFLLLQTNFNWLAYHNLGVIAGVLFFLFAIVAEKKVHRILVMSLFPLFYYLVGAFAWIYIGMQMVYSLLVDRSVVRYFYPISFLITAVVSFFLFKEVLFFRTGNDLVLFPVPYNVKFEHPLFFYLLVGFLVLLPLLAAGALALNKMKRKAGIISQAAVASVFTVTVLLLFILDDPKDRNLFHLEKLVCDQDWDAAIAFQEKHQSTNMIAQYYYNLALSERGQLCDRLFFGRQDYGPNSLIISWETNSEIRRIFRGAYFFYTVGLINEAHRWAFESMVSQGFFPENIKLLIKTELINGHLSMAKKYVAVLKKTLHYRRMAEKYEEMIENPGSIILDPELGAKRELLPKEDFSIRVSNPQANIPLLLYNNPTNKIAFEYSIAWYLLQKNVDAVANEAGRMNEMNYTRIPGHIEEALVVFAFNGRPLPELGELKIREQTQSHFLKYSMFANPFSADISSGSAENNDAFKNTFWHYLDYH